MADFPYEAVLFDLDGTLTRSEEGIFNCARYALQKMGREIPGEDVFRRFIGPPLYVSFRDLMHMNDAECLQAIAYYKERYGDVGLYENAVYTGIRPLLKALKNRGVYLAVTTGKPQGPTEKILDHFGLANFLTLWQARENWTRMAESVPRLRVYCRKITAAPCWWGTAPMMCAALMNRGSIASP